jgi:Xaa-Pro aminopeptidase
MTMTALSRRILPIKKRAEIVNSILRKRLDTILPAVMRETGIDMWLIICNEDNFDPVFKTMIPMDTWTPVLQMLVFFDRGEEKGVERINLSRTNTHDLYDVPYAVKVPEPQWDWLREIVVARDPKRIAINEADVIWAADGLTANLKRRLLETLPQTYVDRLVSGEDLARRWLETLTEDEMELYPYIVSVAHDMHRLILSDQYITPGVTTTDDLKWAFLQLCTDLGVEPNVPFASFELVRSDEMKRKYGPDDKTIRRGDFVHCDIGIYYLRLYTDHHIWAYVLREGETDAPEGFKRLMADGNRLEDIMLEEMVQGRTGNEILRATLARAREEGLMNPRVFSHSCGLLLHEPGPLIGHPNEQEHWAGRGDVELNYDSAFVVEISVDGAIPEWGGQIVRMPLEEQILFTRQGAQYMDGRQTSFYLI